jgi:riboflavin kinase / FMN adenylyltransferase
MKPLTFSGRVERGEGMAGKTLSCPTANIAIEQGVIIPALGVYVGETLLDGSRYPSLICISDGRTGYNLKMEVHLLGFSKDLMGKIISVNLFEKLRDVIPFPGEEKMAAIVAQDMDHAREWFETGVLPNAGYQ